MEKCEGILRTILEVHKTGGGGLNICWLWHCMGHPKELIPEAEGPGHGKTVGTEYLLHLIGFLARAECCLVLGPNHF